MHERHPKLGHSIVLNLRLSGFTGVTFMKLKTPSLTDKGRQHIGGICSIMKGVEARFTFKELSQSILNSLTQKGYDLRLRHRRVPARSRVLTGYTGALVCQPLVCKKQQRLSKIKHSESSKPLVTLPVKTKKMASLSLSPTSPPLTHMYHVRSQSPPTYVHITSGS